jgi:hypothetical protein
VGYTTGILYAALQSPIGMGTRFFKPVLPLYLLLLAISLDRYADSGMRAKIRHWPIIGCGSLAVLYIGVNLPDLFNAPAPARHEGLAAHYLETSADGQTLARWTATHFSPKETVAAMNGQATGYLLRRPTLGFPEGRYSVERWTCTEVKRQMQRFDARYLILYKPVTDSKSTPLHEDVLAESPFLKGAARDNRVAVACGFSLAAENRDVRILKL